MGVYGLGFRSLGPGGSRVSGVKALDLHPSMGLRHLLLTPQRKVRAKGLGMHDWAKAVAAQ